MPSHTTIAPMAARKFLRLSAIVAVALASLAGFPESGPEHAAGRSTKKAEPAQPAGPDAELSLLISEGLNWLDGGRDDMAQKVFLQVLKRDPGNPDASLQLGVLHLRRKLLDPAIEYFRAADTHRHRFLLPQTGYEVHLYLAAAWREYRRPDLEETALQNLLTRATGYPDGGISLVKIPPPEAELHLGKPPRPELDEEGVPRLDAAREAAGKALFSLALLTRSQGRGMESRLYFEKAVAFAWHRRACHLYLAHWYAVRTEDDVNAALTAWAKLHPAFKKKSEDRSFFLRRHVRLMEENDSSGSDESDFLVAPVQIQLREEVRRVLSAVENGQRDATVATLQAKAAPPPPGRVPAKP